MADTNAGPPSGSSSRIDELRARWEQDRTSRIFLQLAEELRHEGRFEEALAVLEVGVEQHPQWGAAQVALGRCRIELGRYEPGCLVLETVVRKDPTQMVAYRLLVDGYLGLGEAGPARDRLELYRELNPQDDDLTELEERLIALERAAEETTQSPSPESSGPPPENAAVLPSLPPVPRTESATLSPLVPESSSPIGHSAELFALPKSTAEVSPTLDLSSLAPPRRLFRPGSAGAGLELPRTPPGPQPESGQSPPDPSAHAVLEARESALDEAPLADSPSIDSESALTAGSPEGEGSPGREESAESAPIGADVQLQSPIVIDPGSAPLVEGDAPTLETRNPLSALEGGLPGHAEAVSIGESALEQTPVEESLTVEEPGAEAEPVDTEPTRPPDPVTLAGAHRSPLEPIMVSGEGTEPLIQDPSPFEPPPPLTSSTGEFPSLPEEAPPASDAPATGAPPVATPTLGELYLDQGHAEDAKSIFEQVLDRDPGNERARVGLGAMTGKAVPSQTDAGDPEESGQTLEPPPPLDALTLLRSHQATPEGITERKSAVLEAYLHRVRPSSREEEV